MTLIHRHPVIRISYFKHHVACIESGVSFACTPDQTVGFSAYKTRDPDRKVIPVNLLTACGIAFLAVFLLLSLLAGLMQLITLIFPERKSSVDPGLVAAITSSVAFAIPGARVTKIEEKS